MKDLLLTSAGDLDVSGFNLHKVDGGPRVAQQVQQRLRGFRGEWFLDLDWGVPWIEDIIGVKPFNASKAATVLADEGGKVSDVSELRVALVEYDSGTRAGSFEAEVKSPLGDTPITGEVP